MSNEEWKRRMGVGERQFVYGRQAGSSRDVPLFREDTGQLNGKYTQHWDGRQDCTLVAPTIVESVRTGESTVKQ